MGFDQTAQKVERSKETLKAAQKVKAKSRTAIKNDRARGFGFVGLAEAVRSSFIYRCRCFPVVPHSLREDPLQL
jgi:hypothetical protein